MTIQYSVAVRNAKLQANEDAIGASPVLRLRSGPPPVNCASADTGTVIATMNLPADWMSAPANGQQAKSGTWDDPSADAQGIIGHYRIYAADGVTCHEQGTVTLEGGGGDIIVQNTNVNAGQPITITTYSKTAGNA